jgi:L-ascorbate metabolism protein UlaG (beta-lactamase superfamily)
MSLPPAPESRSGDEVFDPVKKSGENGFESDALRVGLKPEKGWARRNVSYLGRRLLPVWLRKRGHHADIETPEFNGQLQHAEIEVMWIGHASFLVCTPWANILIDPNWAMWHGPVKRARKPGCKLADLPQIDLVLVSHAHFDHLHRPTLRRVASDQPVLVPEGVGKLFRRMRYSEVREMKKWDSYRLGDSGELEVVFTPSFHWGARMIHDTHRGFGGFLIRTPHSSLYHCGDSAYFEGFKEIGERYEVGTALLPIGAYEAPSGRDVHMNPEEALQAFHDLGAKWMLPMHHATFPLGNEHLDEPLIRLMDAAKIQGVEDRVLAPREGEVVMLES